MATTMPERYTLVIYRVKYRVYNVLNYPDREPMSNCITKDKIVAVIYTIEDEKGNIVERIDLPVHFIQGRESKVIKKIEDVLEGRQKGDKVSVVLTPEEGFGVHQPELAFEDDINNVPPQFHQIGAEVEFQNDQGETRIFRVTKIENGKLTVDGNHPFAGLNITYNLTITEVRDATEDELINGVTELQALH